MSRWSLLIAMVWVLDPPSVWAEATVATPPHHALFALMIGVNASPDRAVAPLQYADDDAARYLDLFRSLGARTYVVSRLDENTRRLHPQTAAEAVPPRRAALDQSVVALARDIAQAHARGVTTTLYVTYAGHGRVDHNGFHLTLEDSQLSGTALLTTVVARAGADYTHLLVDACHAYLLAMPRGPGGTRRAFEGFVELEAMARAGRIGYVLSSSLSGEREAGVFSHELRSGLYGAADADMDGVVTYAEIGAFVARANQPIASERFRPRVIVRPPRKVDVLLDLRKRAGHALLLDGTQTGAHYLLETEYGVRVLDFHGNGEQPVRLMRPPGIGVLYLRDVASGMERSVPPGEGVVELSQLPARSARAQSRGAAHHAFSQIFAYPFDTRDVTAWSQADAARDLQQGAERRAELEHGTFSRRMFGVATLGVGAAMGVAAGVMGISASNIRRAATDDESQRSLAARNDRIETHNQIATGLAIGAATAAVASALLLLWPQDTSTEHAVGLTSGAELGARWSF